MSNNNQKHPYIIMDTYYDQYETEMYCPALDGIVLHLNEEERQDYQAALYNDQRFRHRSWYLVRVIEKNTPSFDDLLDAVEKAKQERVKQEQQRAVNAQKRAEAKKQKQLEKLAKDEQARKELYAALKAEFES